MRVLVLGAGATGGYFGARMHEAGSRVSFLVRPHRAALLAREGLRIRAHEGDIRADVDVLTGINGDQAWDLVLLSCKSYDLESAIEAIMPAVVRGARVLPLLNGIRHLDALDTAFGRDAILGGLCHISVDLQQDGSIRQAGSIARLTFGARNDTASIDPAMLRALLAMPFDVAHRTDILSAIWEKFIFLSALAGITCLMRASIGEIVAAADGADLIRWLYLECAEVARRSGHAPSDEAMGEAIEILNARHSPLKASMLRDLERGGRTEAEHVLGDMLSRASKLGVDTPLLSAACVQLRVHEARLAGSH
ncbi:ketopantoate reductase family protein [Dokdonella sp.]|uniref:ketopantoate reductase family protein n=1 Tax=Dokdonella sp. TaxID=2291710 RepID=UPI003C588667